MQNSPVKIWREKIARYRNLGKQGVVVSATRIVEGMGQLPYWTGMVEMEDGEKVMGKLVVVGDQPPQKGDRVVGVLRILDNGGEWGVIEYGVKYMVERDLAIADIHLQRKGS